MLFPLSIRTEIAWQKYSTFLGISKTRRMRTVQSISVGINFSSTIILPSESGIRVRDRHVQNSYYNSA